MAVNKVVYGDNTLIDLTGDTVTAAKMLSGTTAHDKSGAKITGSITQRDISELSSSGAFVHVKSGYYKLAGNVKVQEATLPTPEISVDSNGLITASAYMHIGGYVGQETTTATQQLPVQAAQTITPSTTDQTISSGIYLTGTQTIKGDANLVPENIASGVSIFGVEGTMEAGGGGSSVPTITIVNNTPVVLTAGTQTIQSGSSFNCTFSYDARYEGFGMFVYMFFFALYGEYTESDLIFTHNNTNIPISVLAGSGVFAGMTFMQVGISGDSKDAVSEGDIIEIRTA